LAAASVNFTTLDQAPANNHAVAGQDYTASSGTVNFATGEQVKTISIPVLADANNTEINETFLVVLSIPVNVTITDGTATGTILVSGPASPLLITELRTSGPAGAGDDFVEVYNNSDQPYTVNASDASGGYGLFKMGATCGDTPVLIGTIPNGTVIPARGHYLFVGSAYSLANYGGSGAATGDQTLLSDIENDRNVGIFTTALVVNLSTANRLDAVGFWQQHWQLMRLAERRNHINTRLVAVRWNTATCVMSVVRRGIRRSWVYVRQAERRSTQTSTSMTSSLWTPPPQLR
jgi:hypothetical protein